jgi:threonine dehydrogenase-like Zn-dependent dehydrogenase
VRALGLVELQGAGERFEDAVGDAAHVAPLDAGVVGDADAGQDGDLLAAQPGDAAAAVGDQPRLLWCDLRPPGGQELSDLASRVHWEDRVGPRAAVWETLPVPLSTGTLTALAAAAFLEDDGVTPDAKARRTMRATVMYGPGDVRVEERDEPLIVEATDAIIRLPATCICGSDLWPYRGLDAPDWPMPMGHEYVGIVEEVGSEVTTIKPGQFVVGSFFASDNTCEICRAGYQSSCVRREPVGAIGTQAELARVPLADGTLVATPDVPPDELIPSFLAASDVLGTGWFGAVAAEVGPGKTVAVVGDGAVGLLAVLAAKQLGAERIIAMSRHESRQRLAREFGATDIVEERGDEGVERIKELTSGLGAHSVIEAVGTQESMMQAIRATRPGGHVGYVGVAHGVELPGEELFYSHVHLHGGPAPVRRFLPELIELIWNREIDPGKVFDLELPLEQAAEGYEAMDLRRAIMVLLRPGSAEPWGDRAAPQARRGAVCVYGRMRQSASRRTQMACATAARVARVSLSGLSIMKSWVMPS